MAEESDAQIERLVGAIHAHKFILQTLVALQLSPDRDPIKGARTLKALMADQLADAPTSGTMDRETEARINHLAAHFLERFWDGVERMLEAQRTSRG